MNRAFTHALAVCVGGALGAGSIAVASQSASQAPPTRADIARIAAELHEISVSAKATNNTIYSGFWKLCRTQLHFSIEDSASIRRWCD